MKRAILMLPFAALAACASDAPISTVRALYQEDAALDRTIYPRYFAQDLAAAMAEAPRPGEGGPMDFDYRHDAQDARISGLRFHGAETDYGYARVIARFENFGQPTDVVWSLCAAPDGVWRIADAGNADDIPWTLRAMLDLPADVTC